MIRPEEVLCCYCGLPVENAVKLECGHVCCFRCVQVYVRQGLMLDRCCGMDRSEAEKVWERKKTVVTCGTCGAWTPVDALTRGTDAETMKKVNAVRERSLKKFHCAIQGCTAIVHEWCPACCVHICVEHSKKHAEQCPEHVVQTMAIKVCADVCAQFARCAEHGQNFRWYCRSCKTECCERCLASHRHHEFVERERFKGMTSDALKQVSAVLDAARAPQPDCNAHIDEAIAGVNQLCDEIVKQVLSQRDAMVHCLEERKKKNARWEAIRKSVMGNVASEFEIHKKALETAQMFDVSGKKLNSLVVTTKHDIARAEWIFQTLDSMISGATVTAKTAPDIKTMIELQMKPEVVPNRQACDTASMVVLEVNGLSKQPEGAFQDEFMPAPAQHISQNMFSSPKTPGGRARLSSPVREFSGMLFQVASPLYENPFGNPQQPIEETNKRATPTISLFPEEPRTEELKKKRRR